MTSTDTFIEPTAEDLKDPLFEAIWQAIKKWDIQRTEGAGYAGATGTDVMTILKAVRPFLQAAIEEGRALERKRALAFIDKLEQSNESHGCTRCWSDDLQSPCTCDSERGHLNSQLSLLRSLITTPTTETV